MRRLTNRRLRFIDGPQGGANTAPDPTAPPASDPASTAPAMGEEKLGDAGIKALQAERAAKAEAEKRAKEYKARLDELEAANLSDLERAKREAAEAVSAKEAAEAEARRFRIAAEHRLAPEDADLLTGDEDHMRRIAARLAANAPAPTQTSADPNGYQAFRPRPNELTPVPAATEPTLAERIVEAEKAGDRALVMRLKAAQLGTK